MGWELWRPPAEPEGPVLCAAETDHVAALRGISQDARILGLIIAGDAARAASGPPHDDGPVKYHPIQRDYNLLLDVVLPLIRVVHLLVPPKPDDEWPELTVAAPDCHVYAAVENAEMAARGRHIWELRARVDEWLVCSRLCVCAFIDASGCAL